MEAGHLPRGYYGGYSTLCQELLWRVDNLQDAMNRGTAIGTAIALDELHSYVTDTVDHAAREARQSIFEKVEVDAEA